MTKQQKADLLRAGERIASKEKFSICGAIGSNFRESEEAQMINPRKYKEYKYTMWWWSRHTMDESFVSENCRNARLIGIAMMLTMPKEIINHKCFKR